MSDGAVTIIVTEETPVVITVTEVGPPGPPGPPGEGVRGEPGPEASEDKISFAWGDATPAVLNVMDTGETIYAITLVIFIPFDGEGATLSIGTDADPDLFMATNECDPRTAGAYSVSPGYRFATEETLKLFITPGAGASAGNGVIMIDY